MTSCGDGSDKVDHIGDDPRRRVICDDVAAIVAVVAARWRRGHSSVIRGRNNLNDVRWRDVVPRVEVRTSMWVVTPVIDVAVIVMLEVVTVAAVEVEVLAVLLSSVGMAASVVVVIVSVIVVVIAAVEVVVAVIAMIFALVVVAVSVVMAVAVSMPVIVVLAMRDGYANGCRQKGHKKPSAKFDCGCIDSHRTPLGNLGLD